MGAGVQNREVPEAQVRDREAEQKAGEEEGGSRRVGQPRQEQEKKIGGCEYFFFWRPQFLCCTYVIGIFHGSLLQDEEKLKNTNKDLTMVKMKSMFAIGGF